MKYVDDARGHLEPPQEVLTTCGPLITTMATGMTIRPHDHASTTLRLFILFRTPFVFRQPPTSGESIVHQIGDRSDPEFESQFLSSSTGVADSAVDACFSTF